MMTMPSPLPVEPEPPTPPDVENVRVAPIAAKLGLTVVQLQSVAKLAGVPILRIPSVKHLMMPASGVDTLRDSIANPPKDEKPAPVNRSARGRVPPATRTRTNA